MSVELREVSVWPHGQSASPVLEGVSCQLQSGEISLVIGKSGAGKSTFLQLLAGLSMPGTGVITYDGQSLWDKRKVRTDLLKAIGYVFQYPEHQLFARSVKAEFDYSLKPYRLSETEHNHRIASAMEEVGLDPSLYTRSPLTLSGGQKRRIALVTTLATHPEWLLLDEPTAGLDPLATQYLIQHLLRQRSTGSGGIVIATHDLDTFFPIADKVIILHQGRIAEIASPEWLCGHPDVLLSAQVGLPVCVTVSQSLAAQGLPVSPSLASPAKVAQSVMRAKTAHAAAGDDKVAAWPDSQTASIPSQSEATHLSTSPTGPGNRALRTFLYRMDPRAKWVCYVALSVGIIVQTHVPGLLLTTLLAIAVLFCAGAESRPFFRSIRPFLYLMLLSVVLSGLRFTPADSTLFWRWIGLSAPAAWVTFRSLYRLLLVMVLGGVLAWTTTQLSMKRGLEQAMSGLNKWKVPVEAFSLATSLVLRFIPLIGKEVRRFAVIVRARGKSQPRMGTVRLRDLPALVIPLILSVFQLGEDLSVAMEARGYTHMGIQRTPVPSIPFRKVDWMAMAISLFVLGALLLVSITW